MIFFTSLSLSSMPPANVLKPPKCLPSGLVPTNSIFELSGLMGTAPAAILTLEGSLASLGSPGVTSTLGDGIRAVPGGVFGLGAGVLSAAGQPNVATTTGIS